MRHAWTALLILALMLLTIVPVASADPGCPPSFHTHPEGDMHEGDHQHIGLAMEAVDINGNGIICVKHVGSDDAYHVHIDDFLP